jgi:hypothetical protein
MRFWVFLVLLKKKRLCRQGLWGHAKLIAF